MLISKLVTIEVTPDIAAKIRLLAESGCFAINTGNATLNFHKGQLKSVKTEVYTYSQELSPQMDSDSLKLHDTLVVKTA